jgi:predicted dinucleotide-binding enzyme
MNETIGIIGSGMIGGKVARLATAAGLDVVICNSRGPESLAGMVSDLGPKLRASTLEDVAASADLIVLAVPFAVYSKLPVDTLAGKIVVDTLNYYPQRDGVMPEVDTMTISTSELVQRHLTKSIVIRAINNVDFVRLLTNARPAKSPDRSALPVAGDDAAAKAMVIALLDRIGYDAVDMGPLAESWRSEPTMPVYVSPYMRPETSYMERKVDTTTFMSAPGRAVSISEVQSLLKSAVRHESMVGTLSAFQ